MRRRHDRRTLARGLAALNRRREPSGPQLAALAAWKRAHDRRTRSRTDERTWQRVTRYFRARAKSQKRRVEREDAGTAKLVERVRGLRDRYIRKLAGEGDPDAADKIVVFALSPKGFKKRWRTNMFVRFLEDKRYEESLAALGEDGWEFFVGVSDEGYPEAGRAKWRL